MPKRIVLNIPVGLFSKISIILLLVNWDFFILWSFSLGKENNAVSDPEKKAETIKLNNNIITDIISSIKIFNI